MMYSFTKMPNLRILVKQTSRHFGTGNIKYNLARESRMLHKLLSRNQKKRNPLNFAYTSVFGLSEMDNSSSQKRRVNVLSTVFMKYITDLMSTGEMSPELMNRSIEISHVEVKSNFKLINVYWIDNSDEPDTPKLLNECAGRLRHELHVLQVMGSVPPIRFIECKGVALLKEVEEKINTLDFGEDHVPPAYPHSILHTVTSKNANSKDADNVFSVTLPVMRNDVFDLDHHKIMSKIKSSLNKSRNTLNKRTRDTGSPRASLFTLDSQNALDFVSEKEHQKQFAKFLNERRKEQRRRNKHCKNNVYYDDDFERENDDYDYDDDDHDDDDNYDYDDYDDYIKEDIVINEDYTEKEFEEKN